VPVFQSRVVEFTTEKWFMTIKIEGVIANKIGFASHQNAVPVLRELTVHNDGDADYNDLELQLVADPPFLEGKTWRLDRLSKDSTLHISERNLTLNAGYLADLAESLTATLILRLSCKDKILYSQSFPIELLAKNEWGGVNSMPELLPAFAMPNDPAVDRILKSASDVLRRAGKADGIDGYESKSRTRTWELASAIWSAVCGLRLSYALPPASFETHGQKVRTPGLILEGGVATCLDTALLFAAALEQAGLNALLMLTKGHAFVGVWLQPQEFSQLITDEASAVRKRIDLKEVLVFETTLATQFPVPGFSQAISNAERQINDEDFIMAIDIHRARMQRIRPLATSISAPKSDMVPESEVAIEALESAPSLPSFDVEILTETDSPAGKLTLWQRKLLDLTTRNRLLHLPDSAKGVRLICPDSGELEDQLASGKRIRIVSVPDLEAGGRDAALYEQQNSESLRDEYARAALSRGEVLATLEKSKLEVALIDLYRKARSDLDEGGANTLFLALGFLKWKKSADDPKTYSAPLILLPVKLDRKSALSGVTMTLLEDEPRFNLTLLELLRHDFELVIPGLEGELPTDESGIDVAGIWNTVRRAIRDVPGFEVTTELVLGTFSFAKYLMWQDLAARSEQLLKSPMVKHLLERSVGGEVYSTSGDFPQPNELDRKVNPADLFTPLPADSSQLAAVVASASGFDFVLDGPPGTGKSQTIANMIAHNLALGRRVLFVAEKMAALDVVYRRLEEKGLGEFCLELHSSKTSKVEVLKQLERAWDVRDALTADEWTAETAKLHKLRNRLNEVVELLHRRSPNGLSVHQAIGRVVRDGNSSVPRLGWPEGTTHDAQTYALLRDVARRLDLNGQAARELSAGFSLLAPTDWSNGWQEAIVAAARDLPGAIERLKVASTSLLKATDLPLAVVHSEDIEQLAKFVALLVDAHGVDLSFVFTLNVSAKISAAKKAIQLIAEYREIEQSLSLRYAPEACRTINLEQVKSDWDVAKGKFWILATFGKKKVAKTLARVGGAVGLSDVESDLVKFSEMQNLLTSLDGLTAELSSVPGWSGISSDTTAMTVAYELGERLRTMISSRAESPEDLISLRGATEKLVVNANELLGGGGFIASALHQLKDALAHFNQATLRFNELGNRPFEAKLTIESLLDASNAIVRQESKLKAWCDWCRVREEAIASGLQPLSDALVANAIPEGGTVGVFETAYARWFATVMIDAEPLLRNFVPAEHTSDIEAFIRLDEDLSKLTVRFIRAKLCGLIPSKNEIGKQGGFGILKHELQKSRRHKPVRQLAVEMGDAMSKLAPCMLMSPLSIAQYLPTDLALFDLVIFDEASQIAPWDAIGSIARGKQVLIAGDPRQMPPTNFFNRAASASEDDTAEDMESILDECLGAGIPSHSLSWHYRSRHESLIAFSNHRYYDSNLITFPAAETRASAVEWRRVDGVYAKGKGRHNQAEAEAIVTETVKRLMDPTFVAAGHTIGIITLNSDQQRLITDLLDRARQQFPQIEPFFQDDIAEPVVVKNLETVQGDERDLIMLGIGYGPTEPGAQVMSMNFGPLNKEGGWRRLNVAITRARREMLVFSSFDASMVDLNRTNARAVRDLKHFIEFAQRGPRALAEAVQGSVGGYDSPFEEAVAQGLRRKGWQVVPQIGVSRFRIDLGIVHPDRPGDYLVGVECDGATYHSAATARDRDKVRSAILKGLGWKLVRLWSTEWWIDKSGALDRLHASLEALLSESRAIAAIITPPQVQPIPNLLLVQSTSVETVVDQAEEVVATPTQDVLIDEPVELKIAGAFAVSASPAIKGEYRATDFTSVSDRISADAFYSQEYDVVLADLIAHVLVQEAPILDSLLVQRIARAHGFQRSGRLIRERVLDLTEQNHYLRSDPVDGQFVWHSENDVVNWNNYRTPGALDDARSVEEIAAEELLTVASLISAGDRPLEIAKTFGVKRLTSAARERIELVMKSTSGF
jgi:very-short-patch-repair endonuclease